MPGYQGVSVREVFANSIETRSDRLPEQRGGRTTVHIGGNHGADYTKRVSRNKESVLSMSSRLASIRDRRPGKDTFCGTCNRLFSFLRFLLGFAIARELSASPTYGRLSAFSQKCTNVRNARKGFLCKTKEVCKFLKRLMPRDGVEPPTPAFSGQRGWLEYFHKIQ